MARTPIVAGNWKMNLGRTPARELLTALKGSLAGIEGIDMAVCPPAPWIGDAADILAGTKIGVGVQNVYWEAQGAFTGEQSAAQLAGVVDYVIIGHSERRHVFGETDEATNKKLKVVLELGMQPMLAVGELREEREGGRTNDVLRRQLLAAFDDVSSLPEGFIVAYEPVWAIGTGLTATPEIAQMTCADIRAIVAERYDADTAANCRIQYGGSANAENAASLMGQPDIDGLLVGGAALQAESFTKICQAAAAAR